MRLKNLSLNTKFTLSIIFIILIFCIIFSFLLYYHLKQKVIEDANEKTRIILTQIDALGNYVKEELRPAIFQLLEETGRKDKFIVEGMSTTHVRLSVMKRFNNKIGYYTYKRVSTEPINPEHLADKIHREFIEYFNKNRDKDFWSGIKRIDNQDILIMAKPVITEKSCLLCHGKRQDCPEALLKLFPRDKDFKWKEGDIMGIEAVYLPIATTLSEIKGIAISTFMFGLVSLVFLFITLQGTFWNFVIKPLKKLSTLFKGIVEGTEPLNQKIEVKTNDEIGELIYSFNQMAKFLYEAQEATKKYAETLRTIFEGITDPLALVDPDCQVEMTNHAYRVWLKEERAAVFHNPCNLEKIENNTISPQLLLKKVIETKKPLSEYWEGKDGNYYFIHIYPIFNNEKEVTKLVYYVKDVTERKKIEEQMRITEKLAAIGQLSAGLAHEINNPLGGIKLCFNNLISTEMDEETKKEHIKLINQGLTKIQEIIKQLLDFSKQTELIKTSVSINDLIENVLRLTEYLISKKGIQVVKKFENIPQILLDQNKIEQVFLNIILNAIQAMDGQERILTIETTMKNNKCQISFSDTGPGIPLEIMEKIFDPFFTTKPVGQGTGLGLSVSKSIVEQHNGKIYVRSTDKGTTFTVELPGNL